MRSGTFLMLLATAGLFACDGAAGSGNDAAPRADGAAPPGDAPPPGSERGEQPPGDGAPPAADQGPPPSGCGRAPGANDRAWTLSQPDRERTFYVHVPVGYDPARPTPVVIDFHGRASNAGQQIFISGLNGVADGAGFIAVHPEGVGQTWNAGLCCGEAQTANVDDVGFARAIIDRLNAELCIDRQRIYATGLSNGGFMAHRLACELADRIAAIASVAGPNASPGCAPARPVPVLHFHGTGDKVVPYDGFVGVLSAPQTMKEWAARNGCNPASQIYFTKDDVSCEEWTGCRDEATVRFCTITDGGHQWPGGWTIPYPWPSKNTSAISASQELWSFFSAHPLR